MTFFRELQHTGKLLLAAVIIAVTTINVLPAQTASADAPPLDLIIDNSLTIPISANNLKPGDTGTKVVQLHNAGTNDGFVSIWLSDIVSTEGDNPESEEGDTSEPGELGQHFNLSLSCKGMDTNIAFPATVNDFPLSYNGTKYIDIIPLKGGQTENLTIQWELPAGTGNVAQGDTLSFSINYLLREAVINDISGVTDPSGNFTSNIIIYSDNKHGSISIKADTTATAADNTTPSEIWLIELDREPPPPPSAKQIASLYYDAGPNGTQFDTPLTITLLYLPGNLPAGTNEHDLYIALWDAAASQWVKLSNCVVNTAAKTISAQITHFSRYTILSPDSGNPPPVVYIPPVGNPAATEEEPELVEVEVTIFDAESTVSVDKNGVLQEDLIFEDEKRNFVVEMKAGTKITDGDGNPLSRIELTTVEIPLVLPDNTIVLTPVYKLTGYDQDKNITDIVFHPGALISIRYNPDDLPENSFVPFLALYSAESGLVPFELTNGFLIDIGWAQAMINSGGLFLVAVEEAPAEPPLPAYFRAYNLVISPEQTIEGSPVRVSVTITNDGEEAGSTEIYLMIDGVIRATKEVTLNARSTQTLTFEISNLAAGSHLIEIAHLTGTVRVERPVIVPLDAGVNWLILDLAVAGTVIAGVIFWFIFMRRARRKEKEEHPYIR